MAEEKKDEAQKPPEKQPEKQPEKHLWSDHKRAWIMTMGMGGLVFISIVVWILTKP